MPATTDTTVPLLLDLSPAQRGSLMDLAAFRRLVRHLLTERVGLRSFVLYRHLAPDRLEVVETTGYGAGAVRDMGRCLESGALEAQALAGVRVHHLGVDPDRPSGVLVHPPPATDGDAPGGDEAGALDADTEAFIVDRLDSHAEIARLLRSYDFTRSILRDAPMGIIAIDTLGRVIFMNGTTERVLGVSVGEAVGADALRIFRTLVDGENLLLEGLECDKPEMEVWVRHHGGGEVPVALTLARIRSREGTVLGAVGMLQDLSEIRAMQERMRHRDRLATIGELAAGIAHEIGNPLTGIRGCAQILRDRLDPTQDSQELIGVILEEVNRLSRLSDQVRHYGRPGAPRMQRRSVLESVDKVLAVLGPVADEAGISIVRTEATKLPAIYHDPDQIQQVLHNLFVNAIDAMGEGGRLEVEIEHVKRKVFEGRPLGRRAGDRFEAHSARVERDYVNVRISDTGPGISEEDQERIFNPFFTTKPAGLGLGLSICQTIVSEHGGLLTVMSQISKGTTFSLDLPVDRRAK